VDLGFILADISGGRSSSDDKENILVFWVLRVIAIFARVFHARQGMYCATVS
jgi:hypothetical protein